MKKNSHRRMSWKVDNKEARLAVLGDTITEMDMSGEQRTGEIVEVSDRGISVVFPDTPKGYCLKLPKKFTCFGVMKGCHQYFLNVKEG